MGDGELSDEGESASTSPRDGTAVVAQFARLAENYGGGEYYSRRREAVLRAFASEISRARRVLDLGCGNGRYLAEFAGPNFANSANSGRLIVGADLSAEMLVEARRRVGDEVSLVRAEASSLPFREASFDFILASHVLPFVADLDKAVASIGRCLAPGGILVATVGHGHVAEALRGALGDKRWAEFEPAVFGSWRRLRRSSVSEKSYREAFVAAGLSVERVVVGFEVGWPAIEEWIRLRWMPVAAEGERSHVERLTSESGRIVGGRSFALEERMMVGRRR